MPGGLQIFGGGGATVPLWGMVIMVIPPMLGSPALPQTAAQLCTHPHRRFKQLNISHKYTQIHSLAALKSSTQLFTQLYTDTQPHTALHSAPL